MSVAGFICSIEVCVNAAAAITSLKRYRIMLLRKFLFALVLPDFNISRSPHSIW